MATKKEQDKMPDGGDASAATEHCEAMYRSSDDVRESFIAGIEAFTVKPVEYSVVDGVAIFEGDIALGTVDQMEQVRSSMMKDSATMADASISGRGIQLPMVEYGVGITGHRYRWPSDIIPFTVQGALRPLVPQAIQYWEQNTRIRNPPASGVTTISPFHAMMKGSEIIDEMELAVEELCCLEAHFRQIENDALSWTIKKYYAEELTEKMRFELCSVEHEVPNAKHSTRGNKYLRNAFPKT